MPQTRNPFPFQCICGMGMRDGLVSLLASMKREPWLGILLALVCVTLVVPAHAMQCCTQLQCLLQRPGTMRLSECGPLGDNFTGFCDLTELSAKISGSISPWWYKQQWNSFVVKQNDQLARYNTMKKIAWVPTVPCNCLPRDRLSSLSYKIADTEYFVLDPSNVVTNTEIWLDQAGGIS